MFLLIPLFLAAPGIAKADPAPAQGDINFWSRSDLQEHMATSYAIAFTSYHLMRDKFEMNQTESIIWSTVGTIALGFVRDKYLFHHDNIGEYMKANFVGATASTVINLTINF